MIIFPQVTIITRTKNRTVLLQRAIKSVISQSYPNWQHIIINDGGDSAPVDELVNRFQEYSGSRTSVIHNPVSLGMEAASNKGLKAATGKYILIHDDDDSLHPSFLEKMVDYAEENHAYGVICQTVRVLEEICDTDVFINQRDLFQPHLKNISLFTLFETNPFPPISFMYRRDVFSKIGYYDESLPVLGDWDFNVRFILQYDIDVLLEPLAYYHHRLDATGTYGNSVIAGHAKHHKYLGIVLSRYLRQDIANKTTGVGELWNLAQGMQKK